jgi:hypothetical protein
VFLVISLRYFPHFPSIPVTGRARFMRGSGVGLVSREEVNSRWFCLESGFWCFVWRSLCYQSLLGTEYSFHTRAHNKSIVQGAYGAPCFLAGFMSIAITHCWRNWLKEPNATTRAGNGCFWVRVNNQYSVNYSQLKWVLKKPDVRKCMGSSGSGKIMNTSSFEHIRTLEYHKKGGNILNDYQLLKDLFCCSN